MSNPLRGWQVDTRFTSAGGSAASYILPLVHWSEQHA
jgi:hypothetical protein